MKNFSFALIAVATVRSKVIAKLEHSWTIYQRFVDLSTSLCLLIQDKFGRFLYDGSMSHHNVYHNASFSVKKESERSD